MIGRADPAQVFSGRRATNSTWVTGQSSGSPVVVDSDATGASRLRTIQSLRLVPDTGSISKPTSVSSAFQSANSSPQNCSCVSDSVFSV